MIRIAMAFVLGALAGAYSDVMWTRAHRVEIVQNVDWSHPSIDNMPNLMVPAFSNDLVCRTPYCGGPGSPKIGEPSP